MYELHCDRCEYVEEGFDDFMDAVKFKKEYGWKSMKVRDGWEDICSTCVNLER